MKKDLFIWHSLTNFQDQSKTAKLMLLRSSTPIFHSLQSTNRTPLLFIFRVSKEVLFLGLSIHFCQCEAVSPSDPSVQLICLGPSLTAAPMCLAASRRLFRSDKLNKRGKTPPLHGVPRNTLKPFKRIFSRVA